MQHLCESVTLHDAVLDPVHLQVHGDVEVLPQVGGATVTLGETLALDPFSLWYPGIRHRGLHNAHGVVLQVVVDDHWPNAVVLLRGVEDVLLEVAMEAQHLEGGKRLVKKSFRTILIWPQMVIKLHYLQHCKNIKA